MVSSFLQEGAVALKSRLRRSEVFTKKVRPSRLPELWRSEGFSTQSAAEFFGPESRRSDFSSRKVDVDRAGVPRQREGASHDGGHPESQEKLKLVIVIDSGACK